MVFVKEQMQRLELKETVVSRKRELHGDELVLNSYINMTDKTYYEKGKYITDFSGELLAENFTTDLYRKFNSELGQSDFLSAENAAEKLQEWDVVLWANNIKNYTHDLNLISGILKERTNCKQPGKVLCLIGKSEFANISSVLGERDVGIVYRKFEKIVPVVLDLDKKLIVFLDSGIYLEELKKDYSSNREYHSIASTHPFQSMDGSILLEKESKSGFCQCICASTEEKRETPTISDNVNIFLALVERYDCLQFCEIDRRSSLLYDGYETTRGGPLDSISEESAEEAATGADLNQHDLGKPSTSAEKAPLLLESLSGRPLESIREESAAEAAEASADLNQHDLGKPSTSAEKDPLRLTSLSLPVLQARGDGKSNERQEGESRVMITSAQSSIMGCNAILKDLEAIQQKWKEAEGESSRPKSSTSLQFKLECENISTELKEAIELLVAPEEKGLVIG
ncbi:hypothetical protein GUI12_00555 [Anaplasmataceae bacterium AB001_6]|nr:hypothetical protein GUI12_00555 [Anaplasmataceae bacterium AB001_6]